MGVAAAAEVESKASIDFSEITEKELGVGGEDDELSHPRHLQTTILAGATPVQTYIVPLKERELMESFNVIHFADYTQFDVTSLTSIAVSVRGTILWYDHWEGLSGQDGYEIDVTNPTQPSTQIWGDGDWTNGCVEKIRQRMVRNFGYVCSASDVDIIESGESLVLENSVPTVSRTAADIVFDGGDIIYSSFPVALARGGYPSTGDAGLLGGAIELLEAENWGTEFVAPVGVNTPNDYQHAFGMTELWIMASEDGTVVLHNGIQVGTLDRGEELVIRNALVNDSVTATKPIQVNILTGEVSSNFEMRWYSLMATSRWYNDYYTPVHRTQSMTDSELKQTRVVLFNPGPSTISVQHYERGTNGIYLKNTYNIAPGTNEYSVDLGRNTGSRFITSNPSHVFYALTVTDYHGDPNTPGGTAVDWGHPLIPANKLTSQALIGLGWGCVDNDCGPEHARSVIWITPSVDADIYIDFDGDGTADGAYTPMFLNALQAITVVDNDKDMTGAVIWATQPGQPENIQDVFLAVAWGQDPYLSRTLGGSEMYSLDMGTVVMPLPETTASKYVEHAPDGDRDGDGKYSPGDILRYTIRLTNTGRVDIPQSSIEIVDEAAPLFDQTTYVPGTTLYMSSDEFGVALEPIAVPDDASPNTPFPLDETGLENPAILYVATAHQVSFDVEIKSAMDLTSDVVTNIGHMKHNGIIKDTFEVKLPLSFVPSIDIQTTVYPDSSGGDCPGVETYSGLENTPITYCYVITNTGNTYLDLMTFSDDIGSDLSSMLSGQKLSPGESITLSSPDMLLTEETNVGVILGNPSLVNGYDLPAFSDVTDNDPANVVVVLSVPPTASPTVAPTTLVDTGYPVYGDLCKNFDLAVTEVSVLEQFSFIARTTECIHTTVYVSDEPLTPEEIADCCVGTLGTHWTKFCDGYVMGMGNLQYTIMNEANCTSYDMEPIDSVKYFHVSMQIVDEATYCVGPDITSSRYDVVERKLTTENFECGSTP